jgi:hypothetical protein
VNPIVVAGADVRHANGRGRAILDVAQIASRQVCDIGQEIEFLRLARRQLQSELLGRHIGPRPVGIPAAEDRAVVKRQGIIHAKARVTGARLEVP